MPKKSIVEIIGLLCTILSEAKKETGSDPTNAADEDCKQGISIGFEPRSDVTRDPKQSSFSQTHWQIH